MIDRHVFRAEWLDYNEGIFFVTICSFDKRHLFGKIQNGQMFKNNLGNLISYKIADIVNHHKGVEIHNYIVMPNHIHLLLQLLPAQVGTRPVASDKQMQINKGSLKPSNQRGASCNDHFNSRLAVTIGSFKAAVTREWKKLVLDGQVSQFNNRRTRQVASLPLWQERFHDHYVRDQRAYDNIFNYISTNPENWERDVFNSKVDRD